MREALLEFFAADRAFKVDNDQSNIAFPPQITIDAIFRALDLVPAPILVGMNPAATDIRSNAAGRALFGGGDRNLSLSAPETDRPDFVVYSRGKPVPPDQLPMQRAAATGQPVQSSECELRFDNGVVKYIRGKAEPVFGRDGAVRGSIGVFIDITEARENEQRHALISEEVKHRAKNTLALVQSVARLTLKPKLPRDEYEDFEDRLQVIARTVDAFTPDDGPPQTVREVICATMKGQIAPDMSRVRMTGPEILMPLRVLPPLGMAIHELTTNACKYGALSVEDGSVSINWTKLDGPEILALDWIERGGPKVVPPAKKGFGSRLLTQVLGSPAGKKPEITFNEQGVECRLYVGLA